jgi:hypothetical protein
VLANRNSAVGLRPPLNSDIVRRTRMPAKDDQLSQREFREVLKRTIERDAAAAERDLQLQDLLEAGQELGLSTEVLAKSFESYVEKRRNLEKLPKPAGCATTIEISDGELIVDIPRTGPRLKFLGQVGVGLVFIGTSTQAADNRWLWIFPVVGVWAISQALFRMLATTRVILGTDAGRVERAIGPIRWRRSIDTLHLRARIERGNKDGESNLEPEHVALDYGKHSYRLLEGYSLAEREWVVAHINGWSSESGV